MQYDENLFVGEQISHLKILKRLDSKKYLCKCDCGELCIRDIRTLYVCKSTGRETSCGCVAYINRCKAKTTERSEYVRENKLFKDDIYQSDKWFKSTENRMFEEYNFNTPINIYIDEVKITIA